MHKSIPSLIALTLCTQLALASSMPKPLAPKQQHFVDRMLPKIQIVNDKVLSTRERLINLRSAKSLSKKQAHWVKTVADDYEMPAFKLNKQKDWQTLLRRVDMLPARLVLAQAAHESAWGQSRFAREGNNYFGQWCYQRGCGIIPHKRPKGKHYEIRRYKNPINAIRAYYHNLNTYSAYKKLRLLREKRRESKQLITAKSLLNGLSSYNPSRQKYVAEIRRLMERYFSTITSTRRVKLHKSS